MKSFIPIKFMNIDINEKRLCKPLLLLWFAVFVAFLVFGSVVSVLGIDLEESDKPNKTALVCGGPVIEKQLNQPQLRCLIRE